jgi:hypothetical protein
VTLAAERPRTPIPATQFTLPPASEAASPPEHRGLQRDRVRLLVARPGQIEHRHFFDLPALLAPATSSWSTPPPPWRPPCPGVEVTGTPWRCMSPRQWDVRSGWSKFAGSTASDQIGRLVRGSGCAFPAALTSS